MATTSTPQPDSSSNLSITVESNPSDSRLSELGIQSWPKWGCPPGKYMLKFEAEETCYLVKGKVKVYPKGSSQYVEFGAGKQKAASDQEGSSKQGQSLGSIHCKIKKMEEADEMVTPGEVLGKATDLKAGKGAYAASHNNTIYASLTGFRRIQAPPPASNDKRPTVEVTGHKAHGPVPEPGSVVIARVTKVMARTASADIMCVGPKSVREKFTGIIRQQDVRATEIDKVDMHLSFRPGDIVRAVVLSLGDARAYYLSTAKNELGVVSAESSAGATMVPISWTEMQCPLTGQIELRKVAKVVN